MSDLQVLLEGHAASVGVQLEETPIVSIPANIFRIQFGYLGADPDQVIFKADPALREMNMTLDPEGSRIETDGSLSVS